MKDERVILTAELIAKQGMEEQLKEVLKLLLEPTRNEEGCISYTLHQGKEDAGLFVFYEVWKDQEAFDGHMKTEHFKTFGKKAGEFLEGKSTMTFLREV